MTQSLLTKLTQADVVCSECGTKYGKYSVGCSSVWEGDCDVCGERKPVTEVRDWGYLGKGISELTSEKDMLLSQIDGGPVENEPAIYEQGEIACMFTEAEIAALAQVIEDHGENYPPGANVEYDSAFEKIMTLHDDHCIKYELSPAMKAYNKKYGTWGSGSPEEEKRWEGFRDAFVMLNLGENSND